MRKTGVRIFWLGLVGVLIPALTFVGSFSATAESKLTTVPEGITIAGVRGFDEVRTLILKPSGATQNLKLTSVDLLRKDGLAVFPASLIHPAPSTYAQILSNDLISIPIRFSLSHAPVSGQFSGNLLIRYEGGDTSVPVTLTIKDQPLLPLVLIIAGVFAGLALSTYQTEGLDRDEIIVRIERLRIQMQADEDFISAFSLNNNPFQNRINGVLARVDTALADKQWEESRTLTNTARAIWDKWRGDKTEWLRLLKYKQEELDSRLDQELSTKEPYGKAVKNNLVNAVLQMPEYDRPQQFGEKLQDIGQQLDRYLQGQRQLDHLSLLRNQLNAIQGVEESRKNFWQTKQLGLQHRLDNLLPFDKEGFDAWMHDADTDQSQMTQEIEQAEALEEAERRSVIATRNAELPNLQNERVLALPFISARKPEERPEQADRRIRWNRQVLKGIAIISLTGVGFNQLYISNSTFGASWFGDYFTLLAWGFGAEVSRESVTKVLQRFRLPGV